VRGMLCALEEALTINPLIESEGSPDKRQFMEIAREDSSRRPCAGATRGSRARRHDRLAAARPPQPGAPRLGAQYA